jgi:hypothetical protein
MLSFVLPPQLGPTLRCAAFVGILSLVVSCGRLGFDVLAGEAIPDPSGPQAPDEEQPGEDPGRDAASPGDDRDATIGADAMSDDASCTNCESCDDGMQNQDETAVDCGGATCNACPTCSDGVLNQDELRADCGGDTCAACPTCNNTFALPEPITGLNLALPLYAPTLSADAHTMYFVGGGVTNADVYVASRMDRRAQFSPAELMIALNGAAFEGTPHLSFDGLTVYYASERAGSLGDRDIAYSKRSDLTSPFGSLTWLSSINGPDREQTPTLSIDERTIIFASSRPGGRGGLDLWTAQRATREGAFSAPVNLTEVNTADDESGPALSSDGLTLFFISNAAGGLGGQDIWVASRSDVARPFGTARNLAVVNSEHTEQDAALSADGRELFFSTPRSGTREIWRAIRDCR